MKLGGIALITAACSTGAAQPGRAGLQPGAGSKGDESAASALLERARASPSADRYRRVFDEFSNTRAAGVAREEFAALSLSRARDAIDARDFRRADEAAEDARTHGTEEQTRKAVSELARIDDAHAADVAEKAIGLAGAEGGCALSLAAVAQALRDRPRPRPRFRDALQARTASTLVQCLTAEIEAVYRGGDAKAAAALLTTPDATIALAKEPYGLAVLRLTDLVVARTLDELGKLLAARKWAEALTEITRRHEGGALDDHQAEAARAAVRDRIRADILQRVDAARGSRRATLEAGPLRELVLLAGWEPTPEDVSRALAALALSVECEKLHCAPERPTPVFAWGALDVTPPGMAAGAPAGQPAGQAGHLEHGQALWQVARAGARALVATTDPGSATGPALLDTAAGWVDGTRLRPTPTADWLPPPELLGGVRVWGPLREGAREHSLGIVTSADPKHAVVRRLSDSLELTVDTRLLRLGTVPIGLKVLAFCVDRIHAEPAKVDGAVVKQGDIEKVPVVCERGALAHVEMLSALAADPAWLPPRKP